MDSVKRARSMERKVSEVLYWVWDPIGINDWFANRDEYDGCSLQVVGVLIEELSFEAKQEKVALLLNELCQGRMGLVGKEELCRRTAERLMDILD